jgi:hypothetical protein
VGSTSHEKDTILKGRALSGARDGLFVRSAGSIQTSTVSLYTLYAATTAGLSVNCVAINGVPLVRRRCARITSAAGSKQEEASDLRQEGA